MGMAIALAASITRRTILGGDLAVLDRDHPLGVEALDVPAGDAGKDRLDLAAGHQLGFLDRLADGADGRFRY